MKSETDFFKIEHKNTIPGPGSILISEPFSRDAYFKRSIVLLTSNDTEGSVGFILNKPVEMPFQDLFGEDFDFDASVSLGGPVAVDRIDYLHTLGATIPDSQNVIGNIFWGGNFEVILKLIKSHVIRKDQIRFFLGYSGWSKGQLNSEIQNEYWLVSNSDQHTIMNNDRNYWKNTLLRMGNKYSVWLNLPEDPQFN